MKYATYQQYIPSGVDWLGMFPKHWKEARLCDYVVLINGYPFDSELFDRGEGTPLVRIRNILKNTTEVVWTGKSVPEAVITDGDVLIGMDGDFNVGWWRGGFAMLNQRVCCIRTKKKSDQRFFYYLLPFPLRVINDLAYSTTVKHLSSFDVLKIRFALPTLQEQSTIAAFLDRETERIDTLIMKKERQIELLHEKRAALISHAVTKGLNPNVKMKDSGIEWLGEIPEHWKIHRAKVLFKEVDERSSTGEEELLTVSHITGVTRRSEKNVNMFMAESLEGYKKCNPDDLVINTMWAWMGAMGISAEAGIVSPSYNVYRFRINGHCPSFYDYLFRTGKFIAEVICHSQGVWTSRLRLYPEEFFEIRLPCPPSEEQKEIVTAIRKETGNYDVLKNKIEKSIERLCEYRTALISAAVTGKIDVCGEVAR
jgi:type I restriction enzyme S subunit